METVILFAILTTVDLKPNAIKPAAATQMETKRGVKRTIESCNNVGKRMVSAGIYKTFSCVVVEL